MKKFIAPSVVSLILLIVGCSKNDVSSSSTEESTSSSTISITNPLDGNGVSITISANDVTITSTAYGVAYVIAGSTTNGSIKLYMVPIQKRVNLPLLLQVVS